MQKKLEIDATNHRQDETSNKAKEAPVYLFKHFEKAKIPGIETMLTPNRTNFNFKEASPYLVNINCYRPVYKRQEAYKIEQTAQKQKNTEKHVEIIEISDSDDNSDIHKEHRLVKNLFELTQENIEKHLSRVVRKNRKHSMIDLWRKKVNESRQRKSMIPIDKGDFEIDVTSDTTEKIESQSVQSSHQSVETVVKKSAGNKQLESGTEDSFFTANDLNNGSPIDDNKIMNDAFVEPMTSETILQTQEVYEHRDVENNIVFYENRLLTNKNTNTDSNPLKTKSELLSNTSAESEITDFATPSDYDTDNLRQELKAFGDVPGPITKSTKRLYLKRLIRYKRRPQQTINDGTNYATCSEYPHYSILLFCKYKPIFLTDFSVELLRTMKEEINLLDFINEFAVLERQMVESFQSGPKKNMREGNFKKSFIYLLIDPRISENLLADYQVIVHGIEQVLKDIKAFFDI